MESFGIPRILRLVVLAFCLCVLGCSAHKRPGTGDIAFRLRWEGEADLDLHVEDPAGGHLQFLMPKSESGGILDIDCNAAPDRICSSPIENVFWPTGVAPAGTYKTWVELFQRPQEEVKVPFTLEILLGKTVAVAHRGVITKGAPSAGPYTFAYNPSRP